MVIVTEERILETIKTSNKTDGLTGTEISEIIFNMIRDQRARSSLPKIKHIKTMVYKKIKKLVEQGYLTKHGMRYRLTLKGSMNVDSRQPKDNFQQKNDVYDHMTLSAVSVNPGVAKIIFEDREVEGALKVLDDAMGRADSEVSLFLRKKREK